MEEKRAVTLVLDNWYQQVARASNLLGTLSNDQLLQQIAPNRNTGKYLLGHLTAVHDAMLPLLNFGEKLFPELEDAFITKADGPAATEWEINYLRNCWDEVHRVLNQKIAGTEPAGWFERHQAVSEEDFAKAPNRNKLNVIISRMNHLSYHVGQLILLQSK